MNFSFRELPPRMESSLSLNERLQNHIKSIQKLARKNSTSPRSLIFSLRACPPETPMNPYPNGKSFIRVMIGTQSGKPVFSLDKPYSLHHTSGKNETLVSLEAKIRSYLLQQGIQDISP